jgi:hypothetical protein
MWDLGGQESLRAKWSTYYMNTHVSKAQQKKPYIGSCYETLFLVHYDGN